MLEMAGVGVGAAASCEGAHALSDALNPNTTKSMRIAPSFEFPRAERAYLSFGAIHWAKFYSASAPAGHSPMRSVTMRMRCVI
jgi:hypothetical protein